MVWGEVCRKDGVMGPWPPLLPWIPVGLLLGLIFSEPDRGTTVLLAALTAVLLLLAGSRWLGFGLLFVIGVAGLVYIFSTQATPGERFYGLVGSGKAQGRSRLPNLAITPGIRLRWLEGMGLGKRAHQNQLFA